MEDLVPEVVDRLKATGGLLTTEQLAEYLGIPVATIYAWRHKGEGPAAIRVGKHLRWRPTVVAAWLDGQADAA